MSHHHPRPTHSGHQEQMTGLRSPLLPLPFTNPPSTQPAGDFQECESTRVLPRTKEGSLVGSGYVSSGWGRAAAHVCEDGSLSLHGRYISLEFSLRDFRLQEDGVDMLLPLPVQDRRNRGH